MKRRFCVECRVREAVAIIGGKRKRLRDHPLCPQCYRSLRDRERARRRG